MRHSVTLTPDGRVLDAITGEELTELTDYQLDQVIQQFNPDLPTTREWSRRQTSHTGVRFDNINWIPNPEETHEPEDVCTLLGTLFEIGGDRLVTLYCNNFNLVATAQDLGLTYHCIAKWWQRLRKRLRASGELDKLFTVSK